MKRYRIKNYYVEDYIVQKRIGWFDWYTIKEYPFYFKKKTFKTIEDAKDYIKELIENESKIKEAKYIEYV